MYIAPGKKPDPANGEERLHLLVEGPTEMQVKQARLELQRLLDEETLRLSASTHSSSAAVGRYAVL